MYKNTSLNCCIVQFQYILKQNTLTPGPLFLIVIKQCCKEQAEDLKINMFSCLGIAGNIFSVSAHAVNKLSTKTIFAKTKSTLRTIPQFHATFCNISRQIPLSFISIFVFKNNYIVVLSLQSVDWMFNFSFSKSGSSTCSPIYSSSKVTPNFCENSQV